MKRLERLGSVAFLTIILGLIFHLIAMSYDEWSVNICNTCNNTDILASWHTSLRQRCYKSSLASVFLHPADITPDLMKTSFVTEICLPNQHLFARAPQYANICLTNSLDHPDTACSIGLYDKTACGCDYSIKIKTGLAMTILASFSLGILLFLSHLVSFVKIDYVLRWLIPLCFTLSLLTIIFIIMALSVVSSTLEEDVRELRYSWSLRASTLQDVTSIEKWKQKMGEEIKQKYSINIGWCYGMEVMALYFCLVAAVIYALMFTAKQRPESQKKKNNNRS